MEDEKQEFPDAKPKKTRQIAKLINKSFNATNSPAHSNPHIFLSHERNIVHEFSAIRKLINTLTEAKALIHLDFSQNFVT